jgi:hypothetical protein
MVKWTMDKATAIELLGGSPAKAAREIGITTQAVSKWPALLPPAIADRVQAALARKRLPPEALGLPKLPKG